MLTFRPVDRRFWVVSMSLDVFCRLKRLARMPAVKLIVLSAILDFPFLGVFVFRPPAGDFLPLDAAVSFSRQPNGLCELRPLF